MTDDGDISKRYRELAREEPPRHVDDAIRAAARRAVGTRPAPLVVPTGRQRWYFPLAAAAIIVLAVAVTLQIEREQPGEEIASAPVAPATSPPLEEPRADARTEKPQSAPQPERRRKTESAGSRELRDAAPPTELQKAPEPVPTLPPEPPPAATGDAMSAQRSSSAARSESPRVQAAPPAPDAKAAPLQRRDEATRESSVLAKLGVAPSPEQWLQGIADLRRQRRHEEADKALAEFRKRYPDYRISKEVLEQLEKR